MRRLATIALFAFIVGFAAACAGATMSEKFEALQVAPRERILVVGATGEGKSTFVRSFIDPVWRVVAYDPENEYSSLRSMTVDEFDARWREFRYGVVRQAVRPASGERERGVDGAHERFCQVVNRIAEAGGSELLVVHEESSAYAGPSPGETYPWLTHQVLRGRKRGLSMLLTTQHVHLVPSLYRANASRIIAYAVEGPKANAALEEVLGEHAPLLHQLKPFHYVDYRRRVGAVIRPPVAIT